jgi:hypothetical protein
MTSEQVISELWKDADKILSLPLADDLPQGNIDTEIDEHEINDDVSDM